jgi:Na+/phosphate symporter
MEEEINNFKLISTTIKYKKLGFTYRGISELLHVSKAKIESMVKFKVLLKDFASKERQKVFNKLSKGALMALLKLKKSNDKERYYYVIRRLVEESKGREKFTEESILRIANEYERSKNKKTLEIDEENLLKIINKHFGDLLKKEEVIAK